MTRATLVLGAGMVGTCTALHLALRGHAVVLVDRRDPGEETSYGNAGIIQREAVEPYPFPRELAVLWRTALKVRPHVNYHLSAMPGLAPALAHYWRMSGPAHYPAVARAYAQLIEHATSEHGRLVDAAGAHDLVQREGYRWVFREAASLDAALANADRLQQTYGVRHTPLSTQALAKAEPALRQPLAGGIEWPDPWSVCDPGELVARYAAHAMRLGVRIVRGDATHCARRDPAGLCRLTRAHWMPSTPSSPSAPGPIRCCARWAMRCRCSSSGATTAITPAAQARD